MTLLLILIAFLIMFLGAPLFTVFSGLTLFLLFFANIDSSAMIIEMHRIATTPIIALGGILLPALLQGKYPEKFSLGLVTNSGTLGLLFPPSLPIIIYAIVSKLQINQLFLAGILPGILMVALLSLFSIQKAIAAEVPRTKFNTSRMFNAIKEAMWELP